MQSIVRFLRPKPPYIEHAVNLCLSLAAANLFVVFFCPGRYDIALDSLHLHAFSLRNWLVPCFTLALSKAWLEGR